MPSCLHPALKQLLHHLHPALEQLLDQRAWQRRNCRGEDSVGSMVQRVDDVAHDDDGGCLHALLLCDVSDVLHRASHRPLTRRRRPLHDPDWSAGGIAILCKVCSEFPEPPDSHEEDTGLLRVEGGQLWDAVILSIASHEHHAVCDAAVRDWNPRRKRASEGRGDAGDYFGLKAEAAELNHLFPSAPKDERVANLEACHVLSLQECLNTPPEDLALGLVRAARKFPRNLQLALHQLQDLRRDQSISDHEVCSF
eukprot:CAMPEP_0181309284 /NCGR_PEP_ID=MMETSP1101-20121128/11932_1 /TAXON_ID=46948 /ORGANISM="Rhodomonas abbreviata, Strain Caron Lab Isolate" /LENGTH=252 /DNA_ID=CAMNT_0023415759 /DNA_START=159 /DNA_END=917 /DNA_ORIENTATION=-